MIRSVLIAGMVVHPNTIHQHGAVPAFCPNDINIRARLPNLEDGFVAGTVQILEIPLVIDLVETR